MTKLNSTIKLPDFNQLNTDGLHCSQNNTKHITKQFKQFVNSFKNNNAIESGTKPKTKCIDANRTSPV